MVVRLVIGRFLHEQKPTVLEFGRDYSKIVSSK
jgi:hypothetical protein